MINIFYYKQCTWEKDFFVNDIFKNINNNFIIFNNIDEIKNIEQYSNNILIINDGINIEDTRYLISKLNIFCIFFIGDESNNCIKYYDIIKEYNIKLFFHQYNHIELGYQIPLGYVKNYLNKNSFNVKVKNMNDRKYEFSFVGTIKSDRLEMCDYFLKKFDNNFCKFTQTNWANPDDQEIKPKELFNIYNNSKIVLIGRGNISLDCFRIYEAIVAGAIPVICGEDEEINKTFYFDNDQPIIIKNNNWNDIIKDYINIKDNINKLTEIQEYNIKWWKRQIEKINYNINININK